MLRVAAIAALTVIAPLAAVTPAASAYPAASASPASSASGVSFAIDSVSPQAARPGSVVTVAGTITNRTGSALAGLGVQLYSSDTWFASRSEMHSYASGNGTVPLAAEGDLDLLSTSIRPGGTVTWKASFTATGYPQFGVYPLQAQLSDMTDGGVLATQKTLLPYWPGKSAAVTKLKIAWMWPLIDQPYRQACGALTSTALTKSLAGDGRLGTLLTAGTQNPKSDLTWVLDPALLGDASTMTGTYQVGAGPGWNPGNCTGATEETASAAAAKWLSALKSAVATQPAMITPYGNTDMAALVHRGLAGDLVRAYNLGEAVAGRVLGRTFSPNMALPAGGLADQSVLTTLGAKEHMTSVVLNSTMMPPTAGQDFPPEDAVAALRTIAGTPMEVLLADNTISGLLKGANGPLTAGARFSLQQRFLAETAMIASEAPDSSRSVVISPPETWNPTLPLATSLLQESRAPWLEPAALSSLADNRGPGIQVDRKSPPATKHSARELRRGYLSQVSALGTRLGTFTSILDKPQPQYTTGLDEALAATESSAWRGGGAAAASGAALVRDYAAYLAHAESGVRIISSSEITMAGSSGVLPVTIQNNLKQDVKVTLGASVLAVNAEAAPLTIGQIDQPISISAQQAVVEKLHVSSAPNGTTVIKLQLTNTDGKRLRSPAVTLKVHSTRYGRAILFLIAAAIGLLVLTSVFRAVRRWLRGDKQSGDKQGGDKQSEDNLGGNNLGGDKLRGDNTDPASPGNVMEGAQDPTEAPDELADARRWADDT